MKLEEFNIKVTKISGLRLDIINTILLNLPQIINTKQLRCFLKFQTM